jgi:regulator of chromosome condensation
MARAAGSRAASAKPPATEVKANGTGMSQTPPSDPKLKLKLTLRRNPARSARAGAATNGYAEPADDAEMDEEPVAKKRKPNASNKTARTEILPAAARGAKTSTPPEAKLPARTKALKRKKDDVDDEEAAPEPEAKKTKVAPPKATKAKPKAAPKAAPKATKAKAEVSKPQIEPASKDEEDADMNGASDVEQPAPVEVAEVKTGNWAKQPIVKGPRRIRGEKKEIVPVRYTDPLKVFVFGEGANGELGLGATRKAIDVKRPRYNELLSKHEIVRVATGGMHVLALTKDNRILSWGVNDSGALGRDTSDAKVKTRDVDADDSDSDSEDETGGLIDLEATPIAISDKHFPPNTTFVDIAAGDSCSFALTTEGAVYGWGTFRKNEGIMGFRTKDDVAYFPVYIEGMAKATQIACGTNHVFALTTDGFVYAWGNGQQNQLGRRLTERNLAEGLVPSKVGFRDLSHKKVSHKMVSIASGDYHGFAIAEDGHVWGWGVNNFCETGIFDHVGDEDALILTPRIVDSLVGKQVATIAAGSHHNIAVTQDGQALVWGRCDGSQTGLTRDQLLAIDDEEKLMLNAGKPKILIDPTPLPELNDVAFAACGPDHTIVIDKAGKAHTWGFSANYQTGQGTTDDIEVPTMIDNTATREEKLMWSGCGGQYSVVASVK